MTKTPQDTLQSLGYRVTGPRKAILKVLGPLPLSVREISQKLDDSASYINEASIYRSLGLFIRMGVVQEFDFGDGTKRYEKASDHHHHLICDNCGYIEDVRLKDEKDLFQYLGKKTMFRINRHALEFFGLCNQCSQLNEGVK